MMSGSPSPFAAVPFQTIPTADMLAHRGLYGNPLMSMDPVMHSRWAHSMHDLPSPGPIYPMAEPVEDYNETGRRYEAVHSGRIMSEMQGHFANPVRNWTDPPLTNPKHDVPYEEIKAGFWNQPVETVPVLSIAEQVRFASDYRREHGTPLVAGIGNTDYKNNDTLGRRTNIFGLSVSEEVSAVHVETEYERAERIYKKFKTIERETEFEKFLNRSSAAPIGKTFSILAGGTEISLEVTKEYDKRIKETEDFVRQMNRANHIAEHPEEASDDFLGKSNPLRTVQHSTPENPIWSRPLGDGELIGYKGMGTHTHIGPDYVVITNELNDKDKSIERHPMEWRERDGVIQYQEKKSEPKFDVSSVTGSVIKPVKIEAAAIKSVSI